MELIIIIVVAIIAIIIIYSMMKTNIKELKEKGYTTREIEVLSGISKSKVSRELKEGK